MAIKIVQADSLSDAVEKGIERAEEEVPEPTNVYAEVQDSGLYFVKISTANWRENRLQ